MAASPSLATESTLASPAETNHKSYQTPKGVGLNKTSHAVEPAEPADHCISGCGERPTGPAEGAEKSKNFSVPVSFPDFYETGLVGIFADLAELFGNPRSYGQIYGLLFAREAALTMEEIAGRLEISQGSISQGLRQLEAFGAVVKEKPDGSRQALYSAKLEMKLLISGFLKERVIPRLESTESRVEEIRRALEADKQSLDASLLETANHRLGRVAKWHRSARTILPIARKILGGG